MAAAAAAVPAKRPAEADVIPIDSPLRFRRCGYIYGLAPGDEPAPPPLPLSVDAVLLEAAERAAAREAAAARAAEGGGAAVGGAAAALAEVGADEEGAPSSGARGGAAATAGAGADATAGPAAAGAGAREPRLVAASGEEVRLPPGSKLILGRHSSCGVVVSERYVSGQHCILHCSDDGLVYAEDVSSNSTYVNGTPVVKGSRRCLQHNDRLALTRRSAGWVFSGQARR